MFKQPNENCVCIMNKYMKNDYNIFYQFAIIRVKMFKHSNENCE